MTWSFINRVEQLTLRHVGHLEQQQERQAEKAHPQCSATVTVHIFFQKDTHDRKYIFFSNSDHTVERNLNQVELDDNANVRIVKPPKQR